MRSLIYLISLLSTLGSLSFSNIYGWEPFLLSKIQRSLMYPIPAIMFLYILKDSYGYQKYIYVFSSLGIAFSAYHLYYFFNNTMIGCGFAFPCVTDMRIVFMGLHIHPAYLPALSFLSFTSILALNSTPMFLNS